LARRDDKSVPLHTRNGNDFSHRFALVVAAVTALPARSRLIDGETVVTDGAGLADCELLRSWRRDAAAMLCAFDLIELDGKESALAHNRERKRTLAKLVRGRHRDIAVNEHYVGDGAIVYRHACKLGCDGIVSKRPGSPYRSGRVKHWLKSNIGSSQEPGGTGDAT
jgi:bifunctional non-homologous end joining protein LigD